MTRDEAIAIIKERLVANDKFNPSFKRFYNQFLEKVWYKELKEQHLDKILTKEPKYDPEVDKYRIYFFLTNQNYDEIPKCPICKERPLKLKGLTIGLGKVCGSKWCMAVYGSITGGKSKGTKCHNANKTRVDTNLIDELVQNYNREKLVELLKDTTLDNQGRPSTSKLRVLIRDFPQLKTLLEEVRQTYYPWIQGDIFATGYKELLYCLEHDISNPPRCPVCGEITPFLNSNAGYAKLCSSKVCQNKWLHMTKTKTGYSISEKKMKYIIQDYGSYDAWLKHLEEKRKATLKTKYGVEHQMHIPEVRDKVLKKMFATRRQKVLDRFYSVCESSGFEVEGIHDRVARVVHKVCGHRFKTSIYNTIMMCPICDAERSTLEKTTIQFIRDVYDGVIETNKRILPAGDIVYEVDIFIPEHKLAIECNGLFYHVTRQNPTGYKTSVPREYHNLKSMIARKQGIRLIHLWEDWITEKPEICKSIIASAMGIYERVFYARDCHVSIIDAQEAADFLNDYHLEGFRNTQDLTCAGLYYKKKLISVLTVGRNMHKQWEIIRYCVKPQTKIVGGFAKLLECVRKKLGLKSVITRSYLELNNFPERTVYARNGFELVMDRGKLFHSTYYGYLEEPHVRVHRLSISRKSIVSTLRSYGYSQEVINQVQQMIQQGRSEDDYMSLLGGKIWSGYFLYEKHF